jgi:hypothetical protein
MTQNAPLNMKNNLRTLLAFSLLALSNPSYAAINEVDPSMFPPPPDSATAARSGERNALTPAIIAANIGVIAALTVLALANSKDAHAHSH